MKKVETNENSFFGGFEAIVNELRPVGTTSGPKTNPGDDDDDSFIEVVPELGLTKIEKEYDIVEPEEIEKALEDGLQEETFEEEEEVTPTRAVASGDVTELGEYEQDVVDFFSDKFSKELGWEFGEDEKPKTVADLVTYMNTIVEESSKPNFANEDIAKMNEYVANGGDIKNFYKETFGGFNPDVVNIESEDVQKKVLKENFTRLGYTPERAEKFISRYEDSGTLQEEAEDALESLKEFNEKKAERLLVDQRNVKTEQVKAQQKFYTDVQDNIGKLDSIRGIPIPAKDKKELVEYIFKPEADGMTKYQKDYAKDYKNLIESAYFTMKGDSLIQKVTQKATSQAAKNLQDKLANKGKRVKNSGGNLEGSQSANLSAWGVVSKQLRKPNF
jgi:hypothetical protein